MDTGIDWKAFMEELALAPWTISEDKKTENRCVYRAHFLSDLNPYYKFDQKVHPDELREAAEEAWMQSYFEAMKKHGVEQLHGTDDDAFEEECIGQERALIVGLPATHREAVIQMFQRIDQPYREPADHVLEVLRHLADGTDNYLTLRYTFDETGTLLKLEHDTHGCDTCLGEQGRKPCKGDIGLYYGAAQRAPLEAVATPST